MDKLNTWKRKFFLFPRKTIDTIWILGFGYRKTIVGVGGMTEGIIYNYKYYTKKELFTAKLKGKE